MRSGCLALAALLAPLVGRIEAQEAQTLRLRSGEGSTVSISIEDRRGYAALPLRALEGLGWSVAADGGAVALRGPEGAEILLQVGSPFFRWNDEILQAADPPYDGGGGTMVPLQLVTDFFPHRLPTHYRFDGATGTLELMGVGRASTGAPGATPISATPAPKEPEKPAPAPEPQLRTPSPYEGTRVVVIDAGHGGQDPGTVGRGGIAEKDVALGIALAVGEFLEGYPQIEVHLTRNDDRLVPIWDRGEIATEMRGDRPGVFVSIHANSSPQRRQVRGFETYFLSEARTEHERRVAAIENAPLRVEELAAEEDEEDLGFILRELRTLDDQHWSAQLAEYVQLELETFHPGPNRGVKQGLLAVLTNAVMPSVLVEVGYLSHNEESRLLGRETFQREAANAIGRAIVRFFERYPPGSGTGG